MATKAKKYTLSWPLNGQQVMDIDEMLDDLYKRVSFALAGSLPNAGALDIGDILYFDGTNLEGLADIATGHVLLSGGVLTVPVWGKVPLTTHVSGTLPTTNGGTGIISYAQGDLLYASATDVLSTLAKDANATRYLSNTGTSNNPAWAQVALATGVSGTLPVANGGTATSTAFTAGSVVFAGTSGVYSQDNANIFWDDSNNRLGLGTTTPSVRLHAAVGDAGTEPSWTAPDVAIFENASGTNAAVQIFTSNAAQGSIQFSDTDARGRGTIAYNHAVDALFFGAGGSQQLAINQVGMVSVGSGSVPTVGSNTIVMTEGTAPSSMGSTTAGFYAADVGGTTQLFGINEADVTYQLTGLDIRKTANESITNSTTHQDDDHLTVNLAASSSYHFELYGFWTTAGATAGISVQLDGTVGVSSLKADIIHQAYASGLSTFTRITAFNAAAGIAGTGDNSFVIKGVIETTTAGTFRLEWAQNSADAVNATTLQENSYLSLHKLNA